VSFDSGALSVSFGDRFGASVRSAFDPLSVNAYGGDVADRAVDLYLVPALPQEFNCIGREGVFDAKGVGHPLVVDAGLVDGFLGVHAEVDYVEDGLQNGAYDSGAAG
jgi:hypothetical protein